jgi:phosphoribosyl 1,2-cyclic phosphate phosphodiesterase
MDIYLHRETMDVVQRSFGYLTGTPDFLDAEKTVLQRRVAHLGFHVIDVNTELDVKGMPVRVFPVYHGGTYISLGFSFGKPGEFVYISDVKIIPPETYQYLRDLPRIKIFVIDCLTWKGIFSHMGLDEALDVVKDLNPEKTYLTGMTCGMGDHDKINKKLAEYNMNVELCYDGMVLDGMQMRTGDCGRSHRGYKRKSTGPI